jgi:hypothetical protein
VRVSRILVALFAGVLVGGLVTVPAAVAAPPTHTELTVDDLSCVFDTQEGDAIFFFASASDGSAGSGMFVESNGVVILDGEGGSAVFGPDFSAVVTLIDLSTGQPVGHATVQATLALVGEPQVEEVREPNGNSWTTGTVTRIDYAVDVTSVTVPGYTVLTEPGDCDGVRITFDVRTTNPSARIFHIPDFESAICSLDGLPDGAVLLSGQEIRTPVFEVVIDDGVNPLKASGELTLRGWSDSATVPLLSLVTGEPVADLTIDVTLTRIGQRTHELVREGGVTVLLSLASYVASITVTTSDGSSGTAECPAITITEKVIDRPDGDG